MGTRADPGRRRTLPAGATVAPVPLLGRDSELAELKRHARSVRSGDGGIVLVSGEAGIGKTRLIAEALAPLESDGVMVLSGGGDELQRQRPFGVVLHALAGADARTDAEVRRLLRGELPAGEQVLGLEARIAELFTSAVRDACEAGPVAVLLDDLQWADESSLLTVKQIAALTASRPLLLVCAHRPYPAGQALRALLASLDYQGAHRLPLDGLVSSSVADLASALTGAPVAAGLGSTLARASGNPFFIESIVRLVLREGTAALAPPAASAGWVAPELRTIILHGLESLPQDTLQALRAAAIAGRRFTVAEVALISPSRIPDLVAALEPALAASVLEPDADGERLAFRHDLIREAIYEELEPALRSALHHELAARLTDAGAADERIAAQLMLGAHVGDRAAITRLRAAAAGMLAASPATAADVLWRARELAAAMPDARMGVLVDLVRPLMWTGQGERAEEVCREALDVGPPGEEEPLFWMGLVNARIFQGRLPQARETAAQALGCTTLTASDELHLRTATAMAGVLLGDPEALAQARVIAETAPRSVPRGIAHDTIVQWELFTGHADRSLAAAEQAEAMREPAELGSRIWQGSGIRVRMWEALALLDLDRVEEATTILAAEIAGRLAVLALPHALKAACHYHAGQYTEAQRDCDAAAAAAELGGSFQPASAPAIAATIALRQGRVDDAEALVSHAEAIRSPAEILGDTIVRWTRALVLEAQGQTAAAAEAAAGALQAYMRTGWASYVAWHAPDLVRMALAADQPEQAAAAAAAAAHAADQLPVASRRAAALRARGLLTDDAGLLQEAVATARQAPRPLDLALTLRDAAVALAHEGEHRSARSLGDEALRLLATLGAAGEQRNARQILRAAGLRPAARSRHKGSTDGWDSLTPTELRIVALTAEGRSNPQIAQALYVTRTTVAWHLSNIYTKLEIRSRGQLTAEAHRREGDQTNPGHSS